MNSAQEPLVIFFVPLGRTSPKCNPFLFKLWHKNFCPFFAESAKKTREQGGKNQGRNSSKRRRDAVDTGAQAAPAAFR